MMPPRARLIQPTVPERDENTCRLEMKFSERTRLGMALLELEKEAAKQRQAHGETAPGRNASENFTEAFTRGDGPTATCTWSVILENGLLYVSDFMSGLWILRPRF